MRHLSRPLSVLCIFLLFSFYIHWIFLIGCIIMWMDVCARDDDYHRHKKSEFNPRLAHTFRGSWCSRGVAEEIWPQAKEHFYVNGYRWYHILPDDFPRVFLNKNFWRSVLGV